MIELGAPGLAAAFAAGFVSFLSPCVLPLVPGYLSLVSGVGFEDLAERPRRVVGASVAFVAGFGAVFVLLGAGAAWFGDVLLANRRPLEIAAGVLIVLAGLVYARVPLPLSVLRERRVGSLRRGVPLLSGAAFAIAWTPCVGPTLAAILALSAAGASPAEGAVLLAVYALGLGIPFVIFALGFARALAVTAFLRRHARGLAAHIGSNARRLRCAARDRSAGAADDRSRPLHRACVVTPRRTYWEAIRARRNRWRAEPHRTSVTAHTPIGVERGGS